MENVYLTNPKRNYNNKNGRENWYSYYASYASEFVEDVLTRLNLSSEQTILDPWNGSGTTTTVANKFNIKSIGIDINPVMLLVAKSKLVSNDSISYIKKSMSDLKEAIYHWKVTKSDLINDPLGVWFRSTSLMMIRNIEQTFLEIHKTTKSELFINDYQTASSIISFYYSVLFQTVKKLTISFKASNPTWVKKPKTTEEKLEVPPQEIFNTFFEQLDEALKTYSISDKSDEVTQLSDIHIGSSDDLNIKNSSIDAVVTSPPYCTRIDYAVATILELSVLGYSHENEIKQLRDKMMGTPTISKIHDQFNFSFNNKIEHVLETIEKHESKASKSYYYKIFYQYFCMLHNSLTEIDRVLKPHSKCVLVVQNSYYKNLLIDLAEIIIEIVFNLNWKLNERFSYKKNTLANISKRNKLYRDSSNVEEIVLIFNKER